MPVTSTHILKVMDRQAGRGGTATVDWDWCQLGLRPHLPGLVPSEGPWPRPRLYYAQHTLIPLNIFYILMGRQHSLGHAQASGDRQRQAGILWHVLELTHIPSFTPTLNCDSPTLPGKRQYLLGHTYTCWDTPIPTRTCPHFLGYANDYWDPPTPPAICLCLLVIVQSY